MALARLPLRHLRQKLSSSLLGHASICDKGSLTGEQQNQRWNKEVLMKRFMATSAGEEEKQEDKEVSVSKKKSPQLFRRRRGRRSLWRPGTDRDFLPTLYDFFPSGMGSALLQATEKINRLFDNFNITTPSQPMMIGRVKEQDGCYKLRYEVPGLTKDDIKITVADGILRIKGEHKSEEENKEGSSSEDEEEFWSRESYGYYDTKLTLPEGAKVEEIKAEVKDGVLTVVIPRTQKTKKDVKEIVVR